MELTLITSVIHQGCVISFELFNAFQGFLQSLGEQWDEFGLIHTLVDITRASSVPTTGAGDHLGDTIGLHFLGVSQLFWLNDIGFKLSAVPVEQGADGLNLILLTNDCSRQCFC